MTTWQTRVGDGPHLTVAHPARQDMCQVTLYFKPTILIHVRRHVSIYVCFYFCTLSPTGAVGNHRRGCLLKEDMSAGDNPNCCSGRLSIGNLIAVLLPAVGIEPTSRYQRTFLRRKSYTTRLPKYLTEYRIRCKCFGSRVV